MKNSEVNERNVVLLCGWCYVVPLLPFLAVVLFSVVFPSCVVLFSSSFSVWFASSLSLVGVLFSLLLVLGVGASLL